MAINIGPSQESGLNIGASQSAPPVVHSISGTLSLVLTLSNPIAPEVSYWRKIVTEHTSPVLANLTIVNKVAIGTAPAANKLHVEKARSDTISSAEAAYRLGGSDVYLFGGSLASSPFSIWMQAFRSFDNLVFPLVLNPSGGNVGVGMIAPRQLFDVAGAIGMLELSVDPPQPLEGNCVIWMSNGAGKGDDGDVLIASKAGGVTKWTTLFDHSAGGAW